MTKYALLCVLIIANLYSCTKPCKIYYDFVVPAEIYPIKEEIKVGDTLWLEFDFSDMVLNYGDKEHYKLKNFDFDMVILLYELIEDTVMYLGQAPGAYPRFSFYYEKGIIDDWSHPRYGYGNLRFVYENNRYYLKAGVIPVHPGIFTLYLKRRTTRATRINTDSKCTEFYSDVIVPINNGNNNYHLLSKYTLTDIYRTDDAKWLYENTHYTFIVKP